MSFDMKRFEQSGLLLAFLVMFAVLCFTVPNFFSPRNLQGLLLSVSLIGSIAMTMMLVLALGEVDLSVASTVALAGVLAAAVCSSTQSVALGVMAGIAVGGLVGLCNGVVVAGLRINSLIATLASMEIVRGLAYITSHGDAVIISQEQFFLLGTGTFLGLGVPVWVNLGLAGVFAVVLNQTVFGKNVLAIGGNAEAAQLAGIAVTRVRIIVFALQGLVAGLAGTLLAARMSLGDPKTSIGLELGVISACVLGGVSLAGGIASVTGVIVGVLIMGAVQNAMSLLNVPTFYQYVIRGGILLAAVLFDQWRQRRRTQRLSTFEPAPLPLESKSS